MSKHNPNESIERSMYTWAYHLARRAAKYSQLTPGGQDSVRDSIVWLFRHYPRLMSKALASWEASIINR